jgi:hypothetical protein
MAAILGYISRFMPCFKYVMSHSGFNVFSHWNYVITCADNNYFDTFIIRQTAAASYTFARLLVVRCRRIRSSETVVCFLLSSVGLSC